MSTRQESRDNYLKAVENGDSHYEGTPCEKYGHTLRYTSGGNCVECKNGRRFQKSVKLMRKGTKIYYYDYWITNIITGIHYIGSKTSYKIPVSGYGNSFSKEECNYMGSSRHLREDIKKYGKENFYKHIIEVYPTDNECRAEEGKLHELYDVDINPLFYNLVRAGKEGFSNSGENHHGFNNNFTLSHSTCNVSMSINIDYEGISCSDSKLYRTLRRENLTNFDDLELISTLPEEPLSYMKSDVLTPEEELDKLTMEDSVDSAVSTLTEKETKIIQMYYGLEPYSREYTYHEIGEGFGLGKTTISPQEHRALRKLRHPSRSKPLLLERYEQMCERVSR